MSQTHGDDWKRFCVNHEGYSGPTRECPTCSPNGARELHGGAASDALSKAMPKVLAMRDAHRSLEQASRSCLLRNIGTPGHPIGGHVYALVRLEDLDALHDALDQLEKARRM